MIGVDEVGRGCLAGPLLVVAARSKAELPNGLKDSKLLSKKQREKIYQTLINVCDYGEGWVSVTEINQNGLAKCLKLGVLRAISRLNADSSEEILMDGIVNYIPAKFINRRCEAKADNVYPIVSAASIIAKVKRDEFMNKLAMKYPEYGFDKHVGYGTREHFAMLKKYGVLADVHRTGFAPLVSLSKGAIS